jgi:Xaa-Pro aminopeptidase
MEKDGTALVQFLIWLESEIRKRKIPELEAAAYLRKCRSRQEGFLDESFSTIPGYSAHGVICHYEAEPEGQFDLDASGLFLFDSGGQYRQGTTDITRTVSLGEPAKREIQDYSLVLKGHIALSRARFPEGTRGYQLDILARQPLWREGLNYGHGTGHGVGFVLNVHEGPQRISPHPVDEALKPGMVTSNEPGLYRQGEYGIRIENLILTVPWEDCPSKDTFYQFETLSLCPYDRKLIDASLLTLEEKAWVNSYHGEVFRRLSPHLSPSEQSWLKEACGEIN